MNTSLKNLLPVAALLLCSINYAAAQSIPWKSGKLLLWSDFQGSPDASSPYAATTHYDLHYNLSWNGAGTITTTVQCTFDKNQSWKKPEKNLTPKLLLHEQIHFDIAELYARKMRQAFQAYATILRHDASTNADIAKIFNSCMSQCKAYHSTYDEETNHSMNEDKQKEWTAKVMKQLSELSEFEIK